MLHISGFRFSPLADFLAQIATCPLGTQAAGGDIDAAYQQCPLHFASKPFMVWQDLQGGFWINHAVMFGVTSGAGICGAALEPVCMILEAAGMGPIGCWVDDFILFTEPVTGSFSPHQSHHPHIAHFLCSQMTISHISPLEEGHAVIPVEVVQITLHPPPGQFVQSWTYSYSLDDVHALTAELGVPWSASKWLPFAFMTVYVGFLWDLWN
jgi:hypothetical protein